MSQKTLYLHFGTPKTATTSIQNFMAHNPEFLHQFGYDYPIFNRKYPGVEGVRNGHFLVSRDYDLALDKENTQYIYELSEKYPNIVLSDEGFYNFGGGYDRFWDKMKAQFIDHGFTIKVIIYLRRQDEYMLSYWSQNIKASKVQQCSVRDYYFMELYKFNEYDYFPYLDRIGKKIGYENVIVRPFEKSQFEGPKHTIISDFLTHIGIDADYNEDPNLKREDNISIKDSVLEMKRFLNMVLDFNVRPNNLIPVQAAVQRQLIKEGKLKNRSGMTPAFRKKVLS
ncbi:MAG: hypothetical protein K6F69_01715, partial [Treponema sp.]|nr:hypothetical protein [Treponema sp.]